MKSWSCFAFAIASLGTARVAIADVPESTVLRPADPDPASTNREPYEPRERHPGRGLKIGGIVLSSLGGANMGAGSVFLLLSAGRGTSDPASPDLTIPGAAMLGGGTLLTAFGIAFYVEGKGKSARSAAAPAASVAVGPSSARLRVAF